MSGVAATQCFKAQSDEWNLFNCSILKKPNADWVTTASHHYSVHRGESRLPITPHYKSKSTSIQTFYGLTYCTVPTKPNVSLRNNISSFMRHLPAFGA